MLCGSMSSFTFFPQLLGIAGHDLAIVFAGPSGCIAFDRPIYNNEPCHGLCEVHHRYHLRLPVLAAVCPESRQLVLQEYHNPNADIEIPRPCYSAAYEHFRFRPGTDILHFNWDEGDEGGYTLWNDEINAIPYFCAVVRKAARNLISTTDRHLRQELDNPFFAGNSRVEALDKYAMRDHWLVLVQTISFEFMDDTQALQSGLFGELELAPVRYVNPTDSETLRRNH
ncbi:hypothetical protein ASPACDRAFT_64876 [Aspergillus aculeatus ATCC 16872]|uniref:Uncharacterized protein n=1 Tax=Aspergillus aculeatus (strain ATCC 16872 / CBS 172.66 / WB 5094) TaxID=690307 RepID=A0A1L9WFT8_ASPA1|nr:uncharacterized protein ASPACDRAFT_64876 [Aspergillus aculeatus ATCC 16872]OJJ94957.1 hypothetical protein ASPACDRAFT_64876 [Aspergillus aculeatus ATCC 16872]